MLANLKFFICILYLKWLSAAEFSNFHSTLCFKLSCSELIIKTLPSSFQANFLFKRLLLRSQFRPYCLCIGITLLASIYNHYTYPTKHFVHAFANQFKQPTILFTPSPTTFTNQAYFLANDLPQPISPTTSFFTTTCLGNSTTNSANPFFFSNYFVNQHALQPTNFLSVIQPHFLAFSTPFPPAIFGKTFHLFVLTAKSWGGGGEAL